RARAVPTPPRQPANAPPALPAPAQVAATPGSWWLSPGGLPGHRPGTGLAREPARTRAGIRCGYGHGLPGRCAGRDPSAVRATHAPYDLRSGIARAGR